ncbi:MAG: helix-turn-helix transcriptional regulator [Flavobacteriaceae bacterium]
MDFSKRLKKIIAHYQLNATSFAEKIDVQRSSISHLLSGRNKPSLDFVLKVLKEFDEVDLYWLLNGKGVFPKSKEIDISSPTLFSETTDSIGIQDSTSENSRKTEKPKDITSKSKIKSLKSDSIKKQQADSDIEKVIIFYKNGSFKVYDDLL